MNILCVTLNSKFIHSSLAPWCLKAGVENFCSYEHNVAVKESTINSDLEKFVNEIIEFKPELVAFSCYIWNIKKLLQIAKIIKEETDCIIALGGPEAEYNSIEILENNNFVDFIVTGEGEWSFSSLVNFLDKKISYDHTEGISCKINNEIISTPKKHHNETPPSPYCDSYYDSLNGRIAYFEASRGCPYKCTYCLSGQLNSTRYFDEKEVFKRIIAISQSSAKTIKFVDRTFNADSHKADAIFKFIKDNYSKNIKPETCFHFEIAADILKAETIDILSEMPVGVCQLEIGIQSFNRETLNAIQRKQNTENLISNIRKLISLRNMHIHIDLIAGLPFEDVNSFKKSFNQAYSLKSDMLQLGFLKFLFGTVMRNCADAYSAKFNSAPPYEIISNKWMSVDDIKLLKNCEDTLDRMYNSGRFKRTCELLFDELNFDPFDTFCDFGSRYDFNGMSLTDFTEAVWQFFKLKCENERLREAILTDINSLPVNIHIPDELIIYDPMYKQLKKKYSEYFQKNINIVILRTVGKVLVIHKDMPDRISGRYYSEIFDIL